MSKRPKIRKRISSSGLDAVIDKAVLDGLASAQKLEAELKDLFEELGVIADSLEVAAGGDAGGEIVSQYSELCARFREETLDRTRRQKRRLRTFNLVFFGRTGAGKSSLIEALSGGDGESISKGESDWTTQVRDVRWRSCLLVDTPGIAGWGRTVSRDELEARAQTAVEDADIVVVCFDTQSQQAGEFARVAEWITAYGKPAIAVLNCRNPRWRFPPRVTSVSARRRLSRSVAEHAGNIRDELGRIGLDQVPVLALSSKRAVFARTRSYKGPDVATRAKLRREFGASELLAWSNLGAMEQLLSAALKEHAEPIRLGMLREQTRGVLERARNALGDAVQVEATVLAEQIEAGITKVLEFLGLPTDRDLQDALPELEHLRGGRFDVSPRGSFQVHAGHRLRATLRAPRNDAKRRAERLIDLSFSERTQISESQFVTKVIKPGAHDTERAVDALLEELKAYLEKQLSLLVGDIHADVAAVISPASVKGNADSNLRALGIGLEVGSGLGGIVGGVLLIGGAANWWNPVGWTALTALAVTGIAAKLFGGRARKTAAEKRERARTSARAEARRSVTETYAALEGQILTEMTETIQGAMREKLNDEVHRACALRRTALAGVAATQSIDQKLDDLGDVISTSGLLATTAIRLEREVHRREPRAGRLLWLGEDWCTDPVGLEDDADASAQGLTESAQPTGSARPLIKLELRLPDTPEAQAGVKWLGRTSKYLEQDEEASQRLNAVHQLAARSRPILTVAGDYSSGKSSLIKRLLTEAGENIPRTLAVSGAPKTTTSRRYPWGTWDLVDTPGFQSTNRRHTLAAKVALVNASAVIVLFNPNLVIGDPDDLQLLLMGDPDLGLLGKLDRTLFVINRSDELGVDPSDDPEMFQILCERKRLELAQALASLPALSRESVSIDPKSVICTASDPFGLVGARLRLSGNEYDEHREWDGMAELVAAVGGPAAHARNAVDVSVLHAGSSRLGQLASRRTAELDVMGDQARMLKRLISDLEAASVSGEALLRSARDRLTTLVSVRVADLFDELLATPDKMTRVARAESLQNWGIDPLLQQQIAEWIDTLDRELTDWTTSVGNRIERRVSSAAFVRAFPAITGAVDLGLLVDESKATKGRKGRATVKNVATKAGGLSQETVLNAGHRVGYKFAPWEATKLTAKLKVVGGAASIIFGAVELVGVARSVAREKKDDREVLELRRDALQAAVSVAEGFFDCGNDSEPSPREVIQGALDALEDVQDEVRERLTHVEGQRTLLRQQRDKCGRAVQNAARICS